MLYFLLTFVLNDIKISMGAAWGYLLSFHCLDIEQLNIIERYDLSVYFHCFGL